MYELRTDWSDAINKAIQNGNPITNYNGSQTYSYEDLDKTGMERLIPLLLSIKHDTKYCDKPL